MAQRIVLLDDEEQFVAGLRIILEGEGYDVEGYTDPQRGLERFRQGDVDLVITDFNMPGMSGLDVLRQIQQEDAGLPVIIVTAYATVDNALDSVKAGAYDYITKPFNVDEIVLTVEKALEHRRLQQENIILHQQIEEKYSFANIIGGAPAMREIYQTIEQVAQTRATVLITGESGTGKELVARALHYTGILNQQPFIVVNCGAIPRNLLESELFGHEKGAFTGAVRQHRGYLEKAEGGTIFLDEIGELPVELQVKFLRVLEGHEFLRVGGTKPLTAKVRVIAATNKNLKQAVADKSFREDLFFRLNVIALELPPLRQRKEDIPFLLRHFLNENIAKLGKKIEMEREAEAWLVQYHWPGNVRELKNLLERLCVLDTTGVITVDDIPDTMRQDNQPLEGNLKQLVDSYEKQLIQQALDEHQGNQNLAATKLGISRQNLYYKVRKYKL